MSTNIGNSSQFLGRLGIQGIQMRRGEPQSLVEPTSRGPDTDPGNAQPPLSPFQRVPPEAAATDIPVPATPVVPAAPATNPFAELPFPAPGDRIKADDFKKLSQSLKIVAGLALLSAQLFGRTFGEARVLLVGQGYGIARVMSVFGNEPGGPTDTSFDNRRVIQVVPATLGERNVLVLVSEAVETRRFAPNFTAGGVSYNYRQAVETMRSVLGEAGMSGLPMESPNLVQRTLAEAARQIQ
jgi:hypothetical protein